MKYIYKCVLLLIIFSSCKAERNKNKELDLRASIVSHQVHFLNGYEYLYKFGTLDSTTRFLVTIQEFDENGNLTKVIQKKRPDSINYPIDSITNIYDSKNNLTETTELKHELDYKSYDLKYVKVIHKSINKYDGNNNRLQLDYFKNGKLSFKAFYKFDDSNRVKGYVSYGAGGLLEDRAEFKYEGDLQTQAMYFDNKNKMTSHSTVSKDNDKIRIKLYNALDSLDGTGEKLVDTKGRVKEYIYQSRDYYNKSIYEFNDWGLNLAETVFDTPNEPTRKIIFEIVRYKK